MTKLTARPKSKSVRPSRPRREIEVDASSVAERTVYCPSQEKSVSLSECSSCVYADSVAPGGDGYLVCTPRELEDAAAPNVKSVAVEAALTPISQVMRPSVLCARADTSVETLVELFVGGRVKAIPITDATGRPIGIVSKTDVLRDQHDRADGEATAAPRDHGTRPRAGFHVVTLAVATAEEVMTPITLWLEETASLAHAAALMARKSIHQIIVLAPATRAVVGLLTADDVVRWVAEISGELPPR